MARKFLNRLMGTQATSTTKRKTQLKIENLEGREVPATILGWDFDPLPGGSNNFGPSPLAATTTDPNITTPVGLTRGSGLGTSGTGAGNAWGGNDYEEGTDLASAVTNNNFFTFGFTVATGTTASLAQFNAFNIRRSGTGPTHYQFQYSLDGVNFTDINASTVIGTNTAAAGNPQSAITLSSISALQNIAAGTTVTFRGVFYRPASEGAGASAGTGYLNDGSGTPGNDFVLDGTVTGGATDAALTLTAAPYTQIEGNSGTTNKTITVTRSGNTNNAVSVQYATSNGTATAGSDYVSASGTLNFGVGVTTQTFDIVVNGDTDVESNETVTVALSNPQVTTGGGTASLGTPSTSTLTITNDDVAGAPTGLVINEVFANPAGTDGPNEYVEIRNTTGSPVSLDNVKFVVVEGDDGSGGGGTADFVVDLTGQTIPANGFLVIKSSLSTLTFPGAAVVVNDSQLDASTGGIENDSQTYLLVFTASAIAEGTDYDTAAPNGVLEGDLGSATVLDSVGYRDDASADPVYGAVFPRFSNITPGGITRLAGNNTINSGNAWYGGVFSGGFGVTYNELISNPGTPIGAQVTPGDANYAAPAAGAFRFAADGFAGSEGGNITVTVERIGGSTGTATISVFTDDLPQTFPGTESFRATAGTDYTGISAGAPTLLTFNNGETSKTLTIAVTQDATAEGNEAFDIFLTGPTGGAVASARKATGTINAEDLATAAPNVYLNEIKNDGPSSDGPNEYLELRGTPGQALTNVYVVSVEGDQNQFNVLTATWTAGTATVQTGSTSPVTHNYLVGDTVIVQGVTPVGYNGTFTITAVTADTFSYALAADPGGAGVGGTTFNQFGRKPGTFDYVFDLTGQTLGSNGLLVIRSSTGVAVQDPNTTVVTDSRFDASAGILENGTNSWFVVYSPTALVQAANPGGGVYETASDYDQDDNGSLEQLPAGAVLLDAVGFSDSGFGDIAYGTFLTSGPTAFSPNGNATRVLESTTPFATNGWRQGDVLFPPAGAVDSTELRYDFANANAPLGGGLTPGAANFSAVENPNGLFVLSAANYNVAENVAGGTVTITVNRIGGTTGTVTVQYATSNGTATQPGDYATATGTLTFLDGELTKTFTVTIADDAVGEAREAFNVTLSTPTGGAALGSPSTGTVTIFDNDGTAPTNVLLNELDVNPPSTDDPFEYVEIKGPVSGQLGNLYFVSVEGDAGTTLGFADVVQDLNNSATGTSGLAVIKNNIGGFTVPGAATSIFNPRFGNTGGTLENGTNSFLLIWSQSTPIVGGTDLDTNDDGTLDLPSGAVVVDAVGWSDGGATDFVYGGVNLNTPAGPQGAATRLLDSTTPNSAGEWYYGALSGATSESVTYGAGSPNLPSGAVLTPGDANFSAAGQTGTLQFSVAGVEVTEGVTTVTVTVTRVGGSTGAASVNYTTADGTATQPGDYTTASGTLNWAAGNADPQTFTVTIANDGTAEPVEEFTATLSGATGATLGTPATQTIRIYDNDGTPAVYLNELDINPPTGNDGPFEYIELKGTASAALTNTYVIVLEAEAGTTTGQADLVFDLSAVSLGTNGLLVIKAETGGFTIPGGTTVVTSTLLNGTGSAIENGSGSFLVVTSPTPITPGTDLDLLDDGLLDLPSGAVVLDSVGFRDLTADKVYGGVRVTQSSGAPDGITRFPTNGAPFAPEAWYNGDLVDTGAGNASLQYSSSQASANLPAGAVLTPGAENYDVSPNGVISLSSATYSVNEGGGSVTVTVRRLGGSTGAITVPFTVTPGSATTPADYSVLTATPLSWAAGETADKTIVINIAQDALTEGSETFTVELGTPTGGATLGTPDDAVVTIVDDEVTATVLLNEVYANPQTQADDAREFVELKSVNPSFALTNTWLLVIEGDAGPGEIDIAVNLGALTTGTNGLLLLGENYTTTNPWAGETAAATALANFPATRIENGSVSLLLVTGFTGVQGNDIDANDDGTIDNPLWGTILDSVGWTDGGANDRIYSPAALGLFGPETDAATRFPTNAGTFATGAWYNGNIQGSGLTPDLGTSYQTGTSSSPNLPAGGKMTPGAVNYDATGPVVTFSAATSSDTEATATRTLTVNLSAPAPVGGVSIPYTVTGTATNPADYTLSAGPLVIPEGATSGTITITVANDTLDENDETVIVTLGTPTTGGAVLGSPSAHTATITDNDNAPTVQFTTTGNSANENVATRTLTVELSAASGLPVTIPYAVSGTATNPADYTISPASPLTIPAGSTSATITITVVDDAAAESDETVIVTLGPPTNATLGANTAFTETIVDNDGGTVYSLSSATYSTAEGQGFVTVTVTRSSGSGAATVDLVAAAGGGNPGATPADFAGGTYTVNFLNGQTVATQTVAVADDAVVDDDETFALTLQNPSSGTVGGTTTATVTIDDPVLAVTGVTATPTGFVATFNRAFRTDAAILNLYEPTTAGTAFAGGADITLRDASSGIVYGSVILDPTDKNKFTFVKTDAVGTTAPNQTALEAGVLTPGANYTVLLKSSANAFQGLDGRVLGGGNYTQTITGPATTTYLVSIPNVVRGGSETNVTVPGGFNLVANATPGIPVFVNTTNGLIESVGFNIEYDPAILDITGATVSAAFSAAGFSATFNPNLGGAAPGLKKARVVLFTGGAGITTGTHIPMVYLQANVPATAPVGAKAVLDLQAIEINGLANNSRDNDGVNVSGYFGDVEGDKDLDPQDITRVAQVAGQLEFNNATDTFPGYAAGGAGQSSFQLADPALIADVDQSGGVVAPQDITREAQNNGNPTLASNVPEIPVIPVSPSTPTGGADPRLYIQNFDATPGSTFQASVRMNVTEPTGLLLESIGVALAFDASRFQISNIQTPVANFSTVGSNANNTTGFANLQIFTGGTGEQYANGADVVVFTFDVTVLGSAPLGASPLNIRVANEAFTTAVNGGAATLNPAPTNASNDANVDGSITVQGATARAFIQTPINTPAGVTVTVPIRVQAGTPFLYESGGYAISFDPTKLQLVSADNVLANFATTGSNIDNTNGTGNINHFTGGTGFNFAAGETQTVVNLVFQVLPSASGSTPINLRVNNSAYTTAINGGAITLTPAPTNGSADATVDGLVNITVNGNTPPFNLVPSVRQSFLTGTSRVFSGGTGNAITVSDPDAGTANVTTTLTVAGGTLTPGGTVPATVTVTGTGTGTLQLVGPTADITTALSGLTYTPPAGFFGDLVLNVTTNDGGNTGFGGPLTDARSVPMTVVKLFISELRINDGDNVGTGTAGNEYIEIRSSSPTFTIPGGVYLVGVEGDSVSGVGAVQDIFDLGGFVTGANGYLALLQRNNGFGAGQQVAAGAVLTMTNTGSTVVANNVGFGNAGGSTYTTTEGGTTTKSNVHVAGTRVAPEIVGDVENASATFFLIQTATAPTTAQDIDTDNNGTIDAVVSGWNVFDSVGLLDNNSATDAAYGQINFGSTGTTVAGSTSVPTAFVPDYVARLGEFAGFSAGEWVAADTGAGAAGALGTNTAGLNAAAPLNDIGGLNTFAAYFTGVDVNGGGDNQRSQITSLFVNFSDILDQGTDPANYAGMFTLTRQGGGTVGLTVLAVDESQGFTTVILTFDTGANTYTLGNPDPNGISNIALNDGVYTLGINSTVATVGGTPIDGDGNGVAGGNGSFTFRRLFGDVNGDGKVDNAGGDPTAFGNAYGPSGTYSWSLDYDGDGDVDDDDFAQFDARYNI